MIQVFSFVCILTWSLLGVTFKISDEHPRPFLYAESPHPPGLGDEIKISPLDRKEKKSRQNTCGEAYR